MPKSNKEGELTIFTFPDTGVKIPIRRISPMLAMQLQKDFPEPLPPMQQVDYGNGPTIEANVASPKYIQDLKKYQIEFEQRMRALIIKRGVALKITPEIQAEIDDLRKFYRDEYGKELEKDDVIVYISYIAIGSDSDLTDLINAIMRRSQVTEAAITDNVKNFQGHV